MKITLIHPPLDDPTLPYHANAYLLGNLRYQGFTDSTMRDINIEFINYCLEEKNVCRFYAERERRLHDLAKKSELSFADQLNFLETWQSDPIEAHDLARTAEQFRNKGSFLDYSLYKDNVKRLDHYFTFLGSLCFPGGFHNFQEVSRCRFSIYNLADLFNPGLADSACYCFAQFFNERLVRDAEFLNTDCFGISITYDHQLMHALWLARALKRQWPHKSVLLGGTAVSQAYKYLKDKQEMARFFDRCDGIVVGEGETAICQIAGLQGELTPQSSVVNTITYDRARQELHFPERIHYESLPTLGPPVYESPWHLYLSPEKGINYAPTRGCYWNRCTFCDYGLNTDRPTSPWRERKIDQVISDLQQVVTQQGVRYVYFAVDVMAPGYLERLSDAILDAGLDIRWSAELRMEKIFSLERCQKMAKAGCVCASFGMESGNQRILDLIDKGTKVAYMAETLKNFAHAGIAAQLMAFSGFPTETAAEKKATLEFIESNREYWSNGGLGKFLLTGTAIIARQPERFGIKLMEAENADIRRCVNYQIEGSENQETLTTEEYDASFDDHGGIFPRAHGRPWAGGTDTLHSMIYYSAFGRSFFKENSLGKNGASTAAPQQNEWLDGILVVSARLAQSPFDIGRILANRKQTKELVRELSRSAPREHTYAEFLALRSTVEKSSGGDAYWAIHDGKCLKIDKTIHAILAEAARVATTPRQILAKFKGEDRMRVELYLERLQAGGLVTIAIASSSTAVSCD